MYGLSLQCARCEVESVCVCPSDSAGDELSADNQLLCSPGRVQPEQEQVT